MRFSRIARCALVAPVLWLALGTATTTEARAEDKITVAVLYFDYNGSSEELSFLRKGLAQMLIADLTGTPGIAVVERIRLEEILKELDLNKSKRIDRRSAVQVGKLLGAHYIVFGSYTVFREQLIVSATISKVETSHHLLSGENHKGTFEGFFELEQKLAAKLRETMIENIDTLESGVTRQSSRKGSKTGRKGTAAGGTKAGKKPRKLKKPKKLDARQAARYGKALDDIDRGDKKAARKELEAIVKEQPDFELASIDLAGLSQ